MTTTRKPHWIFYHHRVAVCEYCGGTDELVPDGGVNRGNVRTIADRCEPFIAEHSKCRDPIVVCLSLFPKENLGRIDGGEDVVRKLQKLHLACRELLKARVEVLEREKKERRRSRSKRRPA